MLPSYHPSGAGEAEDRGLDRLGRVPGVASLATCGAGGEKGVNANGEGQNVEAKWGRQERCGA